MTCLINKPSNLEFDIAMIHDKYPSITWVFLNIRFSTTVDDDVAEKGLRASANRFNDLLGDKNGVTDIVGESQVVIVEAIIREFLFI
jgi:hypothetical protein